MDGNRTVCFSFRNSDRACHNNEIEKTPLRRNANRRAFDVVEPRDDRMMTQRDAEKVRAILNDVVHAKNIPIACTYVFFARTLHGAYDTWGRVTQTAIFILIFQALHGETTVVCSPTVSNTVRTETLAGLTLPWRNMLRFAIK